MLETYAAFGHQELPIAADLKFVIILRDPIQRLISWYNMSRNAGWLIPYSHCTQYHMTLYKRGDGKGSKKNANGESDLNCKGTFANMVEQMIRMYSHCLHVVAQASQGDQGAVFSLLLAYDWQFIYDTCILGEDGKINIVLEALLNGFYSHQIKHWLQYYSSGQFFLTSLDTFSEDNNSVMKNLFRFILDNDDDVEASREHWNFMENSRQDSHKDDSQLGQEIDVLHVSPELSSMLCTFYKPYMDDLTKLILNFQNSTHEMYGMNVNINLGFQNDIFNYYHRCNITNYE